MKIVIDDKIPFIKGVLEPYADILYRKGSDICREDIFDSDALLIRTRTRVNKELLEGTTVKFVGSATIGTDHVDEKWCAANGVKFVSAPGCNSGSVTQYIAASLASLQEDIGYDQNDMTIGIIGVGNIGTKVATLAQNLGYKILLNDPPRSRQEDSGMFVPLHKLIENSDIISVHVPLVLEGRDRTHNLIDASLLNGSKKGIILINTSRGGVVMENDVVNLLQTGHLSKLVVDVWDNEPEINTELLEQAFIATPHIAGYSLDGKMNGTSTILKELSSYFDIRINFNLAEMIPPPDDETIVLDKSASKDSRQINSSIFHTYPIHEDHKLLVNDPGAFESQRDNYRKRREFHAYKTSGNNIKVVELLRKIGFS